MIKQLYTCKRVRWLVIYGVTAAWLVAINVTYGDIVKGVLW